jgi:carbonic anhydrase/SulP family sulfate permease
LIREFKDVTGPALKVQVSLRGFQEKYKLSDDVQFVDYTTRELQNQLTPSRVLQLLKEGNVRFHTGHRLDRDLSTAGQETAKTESPMAVVFSGIDPRTPAEMIFDLGLGDVYSIRSAGSVLSPSVVGSMEYGCVIGGAKLILILGHTGSGLVDFAMRQMCMETRLEDIQACPDLMHALSEIQRSIPTDQCTLFRNATEAERTRIMDAISRRSVRETIQQLVSHSQELRRRVDRGELAVVGGMFDVTTRTVEFFE